MKAVVRSIGFVVLVVASLLYSVPVSKAAAGQGESTVIPGAVVLEADANGAVKIKLPGPVADREVSKALMNSYVLSDPKNYADAVALSLLTYEATRQRVEGGPQFSETEWADYAEKIFKELDQHVKPALPGGSNGSPTTTLGEVWDATTDLMAETIGAAITVATKGKLSPAQAAGVAFFGGMAESGTEGATKKVRSYFASSAEEEQLTKGKRELASLEGVTAGFHSEAEQGEAFRKGVGPAISSRMGFLPLGNAKTNLRENGKFVSDQLVRGTAAKVSEIHENLNGLREDVKNNHAQVIKYLDDSIGPDGSLTIQVKQLQESFESFQTNIKNDIRQGITDVLNTAKEQEAKDAQKQAYQQYGTAEIDRAYQSGIMLTSGLIGAFDAEMGQKVGVLGQAALTIRSSILTCQQTMSATALKLSFGGDKLVQGLTGFVNLAAGLMQATQMIMSLAFGGKDISMIILELLQEVKQDIRRLHEDMNKRFDLIDMKLNAMFEAMLNGFEFLAHNQFQIAKGVAEVNLNVLNISRKLDGLSQSMRVYDNALARRIRNEAVASCINFNQPELEPEKLRDCLSSYGLVPRQVRDPISSGDANEFAPTWFPLGERLGQIQKGFPANGDPQLSYAPMGSVFSFLTPVGRAMGALLPGLEPSEQTDWRTKSVFYGASVTGLPNAVQWTSEMDDFYRFGIHNLSSLRRSAASFSSAGAVEEVNALLVANDRIQTELSDIAVKKEIIGGDKPVRASAITLALDYYAHTVKSFRAEVDRQYAEYMAGLRGLDIYKGFAEQDPELIKQNVAPTSLGTVLAPCSGNGPTFNSAIAFDSTPNAPTKLGLDPLVRLLHLIGSRSGKFSVCYEEMVWTDVHTMYQVNRWSTFRAFLETVTADPNASPGAKNIAAELLRFYADKEAQDLNDDSILLSADQMTRLEAEDIFKKYRLNLKFFYRYGKPSLRLVYRFEPAVAWKLKDGSLSTEPIAVGKGIARPGVTEQQYAMGALRPHRIGVLNNVKVEGVPTMKELDRDVYYYNESLVADIGDGEGKRLKNALDNPGEVEKGNILSVALKKDETSIRVPAENPSLFSPDYHRAIRSNLESYGNVFLNQERQRFDDLVFSKVVDPHPENLAPSVRAWGTAYELVHTLISVGLPKSYSSDGRLRSLLLGALSIPSPQMHAAIGRACGFPVNPSAAAQKFATFSTEKFKEQLEAAKLDPQNKQLQPSALCLGLMSDVDSQTLETRGARIPADLVLERRVELLRSHIDAIYEQNSGHEVSPDLERTGRRLRTLEKFLLAGIDRRDIDGVISDLMDDAEMIVKEAK